MFNGKKNTKIRQGGLNFTFVEWFGTKGLKNPGPDERLAILDGKRQHDHIQKTAKEVTISGLINPDYQSDI